MKSLLFAVLPFCLACSASAENSVSLRIVTWNVEGNGDDISPQLIKQQLADKDGVDIWCLQEVRPGLFDDFEQGAEVGEGADFDTIKGSTGGGIRLAIVYNTARLELLDVEQLNSDKFSNHRKPLIAHFKGKESGVEFLVMNNHLASGDASANFDQALVLNDWAGGQTLPIVCTGDDNFRENVTTGNARPGLDEMRDGPWRELMPLSRMRTFANFNSVLDRFMVANEEAVNGWSAVTRVLRRNGDAPATTLNFSDTDEESDHRPVETVFTVPLPEGPVSPLASPGNRSEIAELRERLETLEGKIDRLLELLEE